MKICSVEGCEKPARAKGLCSAHYGRKLEASAPKCSIDGCENKSRARGWCNKHWSRWKRHGDPEAEVQERRYDYPNVCTIPGCDKPSRARGWCSTHHQRWRMNGDPSLVLPPNPPTKEDHYAWQSDDEVGYMTVHWRLHRRSPAKAHKCAHCGDQAVDWAYDHTCPNEKTSPEGYPFTSDLSRYMPLCRLCHKRFDQQNNKPHFDTSKHRNS